MPPLLTPLLSVATLRAAHMGTWYPSGEPLKKMLASASQSATKSDPANISAIIVPHAGYSYCLPTAMHAFGSLDPSKYDRIIVLGPSHFLPTHHCLIPDATSAETPFGAIPFDVDCAQALLSGSPALFKKIDRRSAERENSLELEFPVLKFVYGESLFKIVPIMIGDLSSSQIARAAEALRAFTDDKKTLVVVSSDFCHWGPNYGYTYLPKGDEPVYRRIERLDMDAAAQIASGDPKNFEKYLKSTGNTICGKNAILVMMHLYTGTHVEWPAYAKSADVTDPRESSVSYLAGIVRARA
jgi:AmmeMemoRadiSam system protein B